MKKCLKFEGTSTVIRLVKFYRDVINAITNDLTRSKRMILCPNDNDAKGDAMPASPLCLVLRVNHNLLLSMSFADLC